MSDRVIEPSEIFVEQPFKKQENITHVNPWIRFLARFFDYSLFCLCLLGIKKFYWPLPQERLIPYEFLLWVPVEALLLSTWGKTPGKWFLRTTLKAGKRKQMHFKMALKRSFNVWLRGMGMGIMGLSFLCLAVAYHKLKILRITSWDREDHVEVTHYPLGRWRLLVAVFVALAGLLFYMQEKREFHAQRTVRSFDEYFASKIPATRSHLPAQDSSRCGSDRK